MSAATPAGPAAGPAPPASGWRGLVEQVRTIGVAVLLALAIRAFVIEPYRIPSGSMLPTLLVGDHLFVNRFVYGVRVPFLGVQLPALREPERGDVVVFSVGKDGRAIHPADRRDDLPRERFVKRIVGVPGDRIEVRDEAVWLNGEPLRHEDTGESFGDGIGRALRVVREQLGPRSHLVLYDPQRPGLTGSFVVEPGRYFVMGDNRDDSNDSRSWGSVRREDLKGPAFVLYWSWDWNGPWTELLRPATWWELFRDRMRWSRLGDRIR